MARCASCGSLILFGGKKQESRSYCSDACLARGALAAAAVGLPEALVQERVRSVHQGLCPKCGGAGPVDVHVGHRVWSALFMTSWASHPHVCCRSCGIRRQAGDALFSLFLGWWGFPWGLLLTPVQLVRNVAGMIRGVEASRPSPRLVAAVRTMLAAEALAAQGSAGPVRRTA